jgi:hypothetical protein
MNEFTGFLAICVLFLGILVINLALRVQILEDENRGIINFLLGDVNEPFYYEE